MSRVVKWAQNPVVLFAKVAKIAKSQSAISVLCCENCEKLRKLRNRNLRFLFYVAIATDTQKTELCYLRNCVFFAIAIRNFAISQLSQLSQSILQPCWWALLMLLKYLCLSPPTQKSGKFRKLGNSKTGEIWKILNV